MPGSHDRSLVVPIPAERPAPPASLEADLLAAAARVGDRAAWQRLIEQHDRSVRLFLLSRGIPADRARELAQQTWLRLLEQSERGRLAELKLPGLAFRQAAFLASDERRRAQAGSSLPSSSVEQPADPDGGALEERLISREQLARAGRALAACSPSAQRVFRAVYESPERPHAEIAGELRLSVQRLRQVLCEVRRTLRDAMERDDDATRPR